MLLCHSLFHPFLLSDFKMVDSNSIEWYSLPFQKDPCPDSFSYSDHLIINLRILELEGNGKWSRPFSLACFLVWEKLSLRERKSPEHT